VALHASVVTGSIWLGSSTIKLASAPAPKVMSVALVEQKIVAPVQEAPPEPVTEPPPVIKPEPPPPVPEARPEPPPEPKAVPEPPKEVVEQIEESVDEEQTDKRMESDLASTDTEDEIEEAYIDPVYHADYLHNPRPSYPRISRRLGEQGEVLLRVEVSPHGRPMQVTLHASSGYERLDQAAMEVVEHWQFVPARRGIRSVKAWVIVPIVFSLGG
jgi:protein TonB